MRGAGKPVKAVAGTGFFAGGRKWIAIALSVVVTALIVFLVVSLVNVNQKSSSDPAGQNTGSTERTEKVTRSLSGVSADEDRKNALSAAQNVLNIASVSPKSGLDAKARVEALDKDDMSVISDKLPGTIRFADLLGQDDDLKKSTYESLVALSSYLGDAGKIAPVSDIAYKNVFVDSQTGIAQVPVAAFAESSVPFTLEMVYIDGQWKLSPYSLLTTVKMSAMLAGALDGSGSSASPSATASPSAGK